MFQKNCARNSFLLKSCKNIPRDVLQANMSKILFSHLEPSSQSQGSQRVQALKDYVDDIQIGFGNFGIENLVEILSRTSGNFLKF